jgi:hypothetical protein
MSKEESEIPRAQSSASHRAKVEEIKRRALDQHKRFVEAARTIAAAEDEESFDKALRRIASAPPPKSVQKRKKKARKR